MLEQFVKFLVDNQMLNFKIYDHDARLRIQKFVYLSTLFDIKWKYIFDVYRYGPYSTELAEAYYDLYESQRLSDIPITFKADKFVQILKDKTNGWLEVAATLIDQNDRFDDKTKLVEHVESIKSHYTVGFIDSVLQDLQKTHLLKEERKLFVS